MNDFPRSGSAYDFDKDSLNDLISTSTTPEFGKYDGTGPFDSTVVQIHQELYLQ